MYHRQRNKCYPKRVYLPFSKLHSILAVANLLAHNNISQICYCSQISLQRDLQSSGGNIYFAGNGTRKTQTFVCVFGFSLSANIVVEISLVNGTCKLSLNCQYNLLIS